MQPEITIIFQPYEIDRILTALDHYKYNLSKEPTAQIRALIYDIHKLGDEIREIALEQGAVLFS